MSKFAPLRPPLLDAEIEDRLKKELEPLWNSGMVGSKIAEVLKFGEGDYEPLECHHVYYYRQKFELEQRTAHYEYGKLGDSEFGDPPKKTPDIIRNLLTEEDFKESLAKIGSPSSREFYTGRKRAYLILLFWSGLRKSEIYKLRKNQFEITKEAIILHAVRKKKKVLEMFLPRTFWGIEEAIRWVERFEEYDRPFDISSTTAWKYAKEFAKELYPHFFRANRVTALADDPEMTMTKMRAWFGFSASMIEHYLGTSTRVQVREARKMAKRMKEKKDQKPQ